MAKKPTAARAGPNKHTLSYQLREIIDARGLSAYAVGQLAEVDPGVVSRFLTGERDIRLGTADRLAAALGLRLVEVARKVRPGRPARAVELATGDSIGESDRPDVEGAVGTFVDPRDELDQGGDANL